ncbi:MAG: tRNA (N6-threonylcarbamoyladenosine(37)-N6)-methyltransferase TrmO [Desulfovibrionaceae bacterium]
MNIIYSAIGFFQSPHKETKGMPIQPVGARGVRGSILVLPEFREGLLDLDGFSHVIVLYHLHEIKGSQLRVLPYLDTAEHGIFATRSPKRPNAIGLSVMQLNGVNEDTVFVENVDVLDGTPVIDIKPYVPQFDVWDADRVGWFEGKAQNASHHKSDNRFHGGLAVLEQE